MATPDFQGYVFPPIVSAMCRTEALILLNFPDGIVFKGSTYSLEKPLNKVIASRIEYFFPAKKHIRRQEIKITYTKQLPVEKKSKLRFRNLSKLSYSLREINEFHIQYVT